MAVPVKVSEGVAQGITGHRFAGRRYLQPVEMVHPYIEVQVPQSS